MRVSTRELVGDPPARRSDSSSRTPGRASPRTILPTLFEPDKFLTAPARRGEGSGIGLAIVRTLVDHLGGSLRVASELGKGTTFTVEIPAEFEAPDQADFQKWIPRIICCHRHRLGRQAGTSCPCRPWPRRCPGTCGRSVFMTICATRGTQRVQQLAR